MPNRHRALPIRSRRPNSGSNPASNPGAPAPVSCRADLDGEGPEDAGGGGVAGGVGHLVGAEADLVGASGAGGPGAAGAADGVEGDEAVAGSRAAQPREGGAAREAVA